MHDPVYPPPHSLTHPLPHSHPPLSFVKRSFTFCPALVCLETSRCRLNSTPLKRWDTCAQHGSRHTTLLWRWVVIVVVQEECYRWMWCMLVLMVLLTGEEVASSRARPTLNLNPGPNFDSDSLGAHPSQPHQRLSVRREHHICEAGAAARA